MAAKNGVTKQDAHIARAEMIALLYLLHPVPVKPSSNPIDQLPSLSDRYSLTLKQERELASTLAFLSYIDNDPNHIPAVCLIQTYPPQSVEVSLAVNRAKARDGNQVLQVMKHGLENIFTALQDVASEDSATVERRVFEAIIAMCTQRVLYRLRLVARIGKTSKQSFKVTLNQAIQSALLLRNKQISSGVTQPVIQSFKTRGANVIKMIDAWTKHQTMVRLGSLVEEIQRLKQVEGLENLLESIPNQHMSPSARKSLYNIVSKVARYREAATLLCRLARRTPVVQHIQIAVVSLPESAFQKTQARHETSTLISISGRIGAGKKQKAISQACRLLGKPQPGFDQLLSQQTQQILKEAKIHAEVQILYHCALHATDLPPRVICSSKDACFLCNLFILAHGKTHVPRSHGRLYPAWRLPQLPVLRGVEDRFGQMLEQHARGSLKTLLSRQQKTVYPDPGESTLLTLIHSRSTLGSLPLPHATFQIDTNSALLHAARCTETPQMDARASDVTVSGLSTSRVHLETTNRSSQLDSNEEGQTREMVSIKDVLTHSQHSSESASVTISHDKDNASRVVHICGDDGIQDEPTADRGMPQESITSTRTHSPPDPQTQNVLSRDLQQSHSAAVMNGHESQICDTSSADGTPATEPDMCFEVTHQDGAGRRFNFHDIELFFEIEAPATATVYVRAARPPYGLASPLHTIDTGSLAHGEEIVLHVGDQDNHKSRLALTVEGRGEDTHNQRRWDIGWEVHLPSETAGQAGTVQ